MISSINEKEILKFIDMLIKQKLDSKYIRDLLSILKQILKLANKKVSMPLPKYRKKDIKVLNNVEINNLENYLKNNINSVNIGIYLSLYTGVRIGELCAIRWSDIDLDKKKLSINKSLKRVFVDEVKTSTHIVIDSPKSISSIREIPIPNFLINYLKTFKCNKNDYLLTGNDKYMDPRLFLMKYKKVLSFLNFPNYTFHTLRHTFATRCIAIRL